MNLTSRMLRRVLAVAVSGAVVAGALTACGNAEPGSSAPEKTTPTGTELSIYNDGTTPKPGERNPVEVETDKISGYPTKMTGLNSTTNYIQNVVQSLPTPKTGDILKWWSGKMLQGLAATGQIDDLTPMWDKAVKNGDLDDKMRSLYTYNDKVYAVPSFQAYWAVYYSKPLFAKAGIAGPPQTWAEFEDDAAKLAAIGAPLCTGQTEGWTSFVFFQLLLGAISPDFYRDLTSNKAKFDDPEVKQALTTWKKWIDNGWMTPADTKTFDCPAKMAEGKVGMMPAAQWIGGIFDQVKFDTPDKLGAFLAPSFTDGGRRAVFVETSAYVVPKNTPHKSGSKSWLATSLTEPVQSLNSLSANPKVKAKDPVAQALNETLKDSDAEYLVRYYESLPPKLVQSTISSLGGFMVEPNIEKAMTDMTQQAKAAWAAWDKDPNLGG